MKKIWLVLVLLILTGCSLGSDMTNTPTKKVESYLDGYQKLDSSVLNDLDNLFKNNDYTVEQQDRYKTIMKNHYQKLEYKIKDEKINGDRASVEVEITVIDYRDILSSKEVPDDLKDEEGNYDIVKYYDYQLGLMEKASDTVTYTITFYLTKVDDNWTMDKVSDDTLKKIHGIYIS